ncbi:MAG: TonB-dependent siderophore receptor [Luteolibacter sp.]
MKKNETSPALRAPRASDCLAMTGTLLALGAVAAPLAHAAETKKDDKKKKADESSELPEIVVKADAAKPYNPQNVQSQKFTAPLVNTPQTITAIPKEVYNEQAAQTLNDVLRNVPGITFLSGEGGSPTSGDNQFRMRGFDASNSIFIDGVRDGGQQNRDIFNIEQVDVSRGASGSDVGRSTAAGYINLGTKVPNLVRSISGTSSIGFDEDSSAEPIFRNTLDYNQPIDQSPLNGTAVRLNALFQEGGVSGRDVAEVNRWSIAPSAAVGLGTDTRFLFALQHTEEHNLPDYGLPRAALNNDTYGGGSYSPAAPSVSQDTSYASDKAFEDVYSDVAMFRVERDLSPNLLLSNQTRISVTDRLAMVVAPSSYTAATGLVTRNFTANDRQNKNFSNVTNLRAAFNTWAVEHTLNTSLELSREEVDTTSYSGGVASAVDLENPDHSASVTLPRKSGATTGSVVETYGLSVFDTAKFNRYLQATGGFRAEYYDLDYASKATSGTVTEVGSDDLLINYKAGLVYTPRDNGSVYVSYARSEQNPGTNLNMSASETGTGADNINNDPQESINYELGTKWNFFDNKLSTTLAVYRTVQKNIGIATDSVTGDVVQTGDQVVKGVELGVTGSITENWLVFAGFSYAKSENSNESSTTADGAQLQWTPKLSGNLWTTYRFPFGLTVGGGAQYNDGSSRSTSTADVSNIPGIESYWLFNAMASYELTKNVTVRLNVNNLFDEEYFRSVNNNGNRYNPGPGRSYVISADWKF